MRCTSGRRPTLQARRFADQEQVDALAAHMDSFIQASRHATCCTCLALGAAVQQWLLCGSCRRLACRIAVAAAPAGAGCRTHLNCLLPSPLAYRLLQVFWAACHVRPQLFNQFLVSTLPPPSMDWSGEWARVAYESLPLLTDSDVSGALLLKY